MKRGHRDLRAWKQAIELVEEVYRLTEVFPKTESYGLAQQMRRAAVSVPSNLAEGSARKSTKELIQFASIAVGSLAELDTQLEIATRLKLIRSPESLQLRLDEVSALVLAMIAALKRKTT